MLAQTTQRKTQIGLSLEPGSDCAIFTERRAAAALLICLFLLAGCVAFLHHHHDLQSSTPCPVCYVIHLPARVGTSLHIPQLATLAFAPPVLVYTAWPEPSPNDCSPRAPPA
jgi:hypothetical protein